jgi:hypothetical protein
MTHNASHNASHAPRVPHRDEHADSADRLPPRGDAEACHAQHAPAGQVVLDAPLEVLLARAARLQRLRAHELEVQRVVDVAQAEGDLPGRVGLVERVCRGRQAAQRHAVALHDLEDRAEEPPHVLEAPEAAVLQPHHARDVVVQHHHARAGGVVLADGLLRGRRALAGPQQHADLGEGPRVGLEVLLRLHEDRGLRLQGEAVDELPVALEVEGAHAPPRGDGDVEVQLPGGAGRLAHAACL